MRFLSTLLAATIGTLLALGMVFGIIMLFIAALAASSDGVPDVENGSVLVVEFSGAIPEISSSDPLMDALSPGGLDLRSILLSLEKAAADERISALLLEMKGVDASWGTLQEIRDGLVRFRASGKPIYAASDDYSMTETDYFLASAADSVFAGSQSFFEFNGFYLNVEFYKGLLDKLNVEPQIIRAGRFKSAVEPFIRQDLSAENREQLSAFLSDINGVFLKQIAESRHTSPEALQQLTEESAVITAPGALAAGLIDGLLYRDQVEDVIKRRLGLERDDDLETVEVKKYDRVPEKEAGVKTGSDGEIAVVYAVGSIVSGKSDNTPNPFMGSEQVGAETFTAAMTQARESDRVKSIVLRINSPGGSASASDVMWREIKRTAEQKPVIVSMGDLAASGGYWIATAGDTIVADPLTITGSIGVFALLMNVGDLFSDKLGITFDAVRTSPYADMLSGVRPLSPAEQALMQRWVDQTYQDFLQKVAESRGLETALVDSVGQGRIWTGLQARRLGLVDVLGGLDTAVKIAAERAGLEAGSYRIRILPRPKTFIEQLSESLNTQAIGVWQRFTESPIERRLREHVQVLQRLVDDHAEIQARLPVTVSVR